MPEETHQDEAFELRDYLRVLRRRKLLISAVVLAVAAAAVVASLLQTPVYEAKAQILLQPRSTDTIFDPTASGQSVDAAREVDTEIQLLKSQTVRSIVRSKLGVDPSVTAAAIGQTNVIELAAQSTSPAQAVDVANTYASSFVDFKRKQAVDDDLAAANQVQAQINSLQKQIDAVDAQVGNIGKNSPLQQGLQANRDSLVTQQGTFKQSLERLQASAAIQTGGAQLVTQASLPRTPIKPRPVRNAIVALAVGLLLGVGAAFTKERLDDSIKTKDDIDRVVRDLPVLGLIPAIAGWKDKSRTEIASLSDPTSFAAEAYRTLRTSIQFMGLDRPLRTIQVTSPSVSEGKTTTLANLGVALARAGQRVVMVDCDLRRPRVHRFFGLENELGLTSVLLGEVPLAEAVQQVSGERFLMLLPSGMLPPNPSELLASKRMVQVLTALQADSDVVLVDCPPVLPVTDAAVLSARVDGTLLVATAGVTTRRDLGRALELLGQVDAPLVGAVLNGVTEEGAYGYAYKYRYYEAPTNGELSGQRRRRRGEPAKNA